MNLVERAKNILLTPKTEWPIIAGETATISSLLTTYVFPMAALPAIASLLSGFLIGGGLSINMAIATYVAAVLSFVITAYVVDLLATNFKSEKDLNKSAQLVAYSSTASWIAHILSIVPGIGWLAGILGSLYVIYLMYLGLDTMKKTPEDQKIIYMVVVFIVIVVSSIILAAVLGMLLVAGAVTGS